ncbi:MAG: cell division topological specificity factor MinE [Lachnospiraceae bacterium]|nr:cell division topological specificity factor MinE [Lachnospiraceae bacterium]
MIGKSPSGTIAFERLKSMLAEEKVMIDEETMASIRRDVGNVVLKYVDVEPDNVDIKIILKEYKKKIPC